MPDFGEVQRADEQIIVGLYREPRKQGLGRRSFERVAYDISV
jgi:hypothetical protein